MHTKFICKYYVHIHTCWCLTSDRVMFWYTYHKDNIGSYKLSIPTDALISFMTQWSVECSLLCSLGASELMHSIGLL